ncbi:hypothetical protein BH11PLA1_BH11PLA1_15490 [soil metagenome]
MSTARAQPAPASPAVPLAAFALLASAFVLAGLLLAVLAVRGTGNLDLARSAYAEAVNQGGPGDAALLTTDIGVEELLVVVDQRREELLVYRVANQRALEFVARESLRELFTLARGNVKRTITPMQPVTPLNGSNGR